MIRNIHNLNDSHWIDEHMICILRFEERNVYKSQ